MNRTVWALVPEVALAFAGDTATDTRTSSCPHPVNWASNIAVLNNIAKRGIYRFMKLPF
jgi:hypothetical protein